MYTLMSILNLKTVLNKFLIYCLFHCNTCELIVLLWEDIGADCVVHNVLAVYLAANERTQQVIF